MLLLLQQLAFVLFLGLLCGWFFKKLNPILIILGIIVLIPIANIIMNVDTWYLTLAFVLGFLIHTWKPIYRQIQRQ